MPLARLGETITAGCVGAELVDAANPTRPFEAATLLDDG